MKTKIRRSQLLVIGCFFGFFLFCLVWVQNNTADKLDIELPHS